MMRLKLYRLKNLTLITKATLAVLSEAISKDPLNKKVVIEHILDIQRDMDSMLNLLEYSEDDWEDIDLKTQS